MNSSHIRFVRWYLWRLGFNGMSASKTSYIKDSKISLLMICSFLISMFKVNERQNTDRSNRLFRYRISCSDVLTPEVLSKYYLRKRKILIPVMVLETKICLTLCVFFPKHSRLTPTLIYYNTIYCA